MAKNLATAETNVSEAVYSEFYSEWMDSVRQEKQQKSKTNLILKRAKSAGISIEAMKAAEKLRVMGADKVESDRRELEKVCAWMGVALFTQTSMDLQQPPSSAISQEYARESGYDCGKEGGDRVDGNPFPPGTPNHVAWDAGYMGGQTLLAEGLAPKPKKANASKAKPVLGTGRKPGRPPASSLPN